MVRCKGTKEMMYYNHPRRPSIVVIRYNNFHLSSQHILTEYQIMLRTNIINHELLVLQITEKSK